MAATNPNPVDYLVFECDDYDDFYVHRDDLPQALKRMGFRASNSNDGAVKESLVFKSGRMGVGVDDLVEDLCAKPVSVVREEDDVSEYDRVVSFQNTTLRVIEYFDRDDRIKARLNPATHVLVYLSDDEGVFVSHEWLTSALAEKGFTFHPREPDDQGNIWREFVNGDVTSFCDAAQRAKYKYPTHCPPDGVGEFDTLRPTPTMHHGSEVPGFLLVKHVDRDETLTVDQISYTQSNARVTTALFGNLAATFPEDKTLLAQAESISSAWVNGEIDLRGDEIRHIVDLSRQLTEGRETLKGFLNALNERTHERAPAQHSSLGR